MRNIWTLRLIPPPNLFPLNLLLMPLTFLAFHQHVELQLFLTDQLADAVPLGFLIPARQPLLQGDTNYSIN